MYMLAPFVCDCDGKEGWFKLSNCLYYCFIFFTSRHLHTRFVSEQHVSLRPDASLCNLLASFR